MPIQTIQFGDAGQVASREMLRRYDARALAGPGTAAPGAAALRHDLATLESLDRQYGGEAPLPLEGTDELVASVLQRLADFADPEIAIAVALWAIRHGVAITAVEPVANALAMRSNAAAS